MHIPEGPLKDTQLMKISSKETQRRKEQKPDTRKGSNPWARYILDNNMVSRARNRIESNSLILIRILLMNFRHQHFNQMVRNTYHWKYLTSNSTSMYLLTVYSGKQLHRSQIWGLIIVCKWIFDVKFWCIVNLRLHKVKILMSNSNSTFYNFSDRCLWPFLASDEFVVRE